MICFCLLPQLLFSQANDSTRSKTLADRIWNIDALASVDKPLADMAKRFGPSNRIGFGFKIKDRHNWIYGVRMEFLVGKSIREDSLLYGVKTSLGGIIGSTGNLMNVGKFERGYLIGAQVGKILPLFQANRNSGLMVMGSTGFIQHKIKLFDRDLSFPQLTGDYRKGYDRLTNGWFLEEFVGYNYFSTNKLINAYAGFSLMEGFTKGRRDYLFDVNRADNASRLDMLLSFKIGWVVTIYKKNVEEIYY